MKTHFRVWYEYENVVFVKPHLKINYLLDLNEFLFCLTRRYAQTSTKEGISEIGRPFHGYKYASQT